MLDRETPAELPSPYKDPSGREWTITPYRIPGNPRPARTIIATETMSWDFPESYMVQEKALVSAVTENGPDGPDPKPLLRALRLSA